MSDSIVYATVLERACRIVENELRSLGKDCEVFFLSNGVSIDPPSWPGDAFGSTLYDAIVDALEVQ